MENGTKNAIDISRYIINECHKQSFSITNFKLQKLLYFAQGFSLALTDTPLFYDEIEAWDFGPVIPDVYREYKMFGANELPVIDSYYDIDYDSESFLNLVDINENIFSEVQKLIMDAVVNQYAGFTAVALVSITQKQKPWIDSYGKEQIISKNRVSNYFRTMIN